MLSKEQIRKKYESKLRLFARTGKDKFLWQMEVLGEVLEISSQEEDLLLKKALEDWNNTQDKRIN